MPDVYTKDFPKQSSGKYLSIRECEVEYYDEI